MQTSDPRSAMNKALRITTVTQTTAKGEVIAFQIFGCEVFKEAIKAHVPELLVDTDGEGTELGQSFLYGAYGQPTSMFLHYTNINDDLGWFAKTYIDVICLQLCLRLVIQRMQDQRMSPHTFTPHTEGIRDAVELIQTSFELSPLMGLMPALRQKLQLSGPDLLNYVLKSYVRFTRRSFKDGFNEEERVEIALLMRLATERLGLRTLGEDHKLSEILLKTSERIEHSDYQKPVIVRGWPSTSVYYREIRDPRFRRFRS